MSVFLVARAYGFDRAASALLLGAEHGETLSQSIGLAARDGRWWGRWGSAALSVLVEPDHCERALAGGDGATSGRALVMSGVLLLILAAVLAWGCWAGCEALLWLCRAV